MKSIEGFLKHSKDGLKMEGTEGRGAKDGKKKERKRIRDDSSEK